MGLAPSFVRLLERCLLLDADRRRETKEGEDPPWLLLPLLPSLAQDADLGAPIAVAASWLLLYHSAHILDNIEDRQPIKLGREIDDAQIINASTALLVGAFKSLSRIRDFRVADAVTAQIEADFQDCVLYMSSSQHEDLSIKRPTVDKCWKIARRKSGSFFALPCRSGARLITDDATVIAKWDRFGHSLGMMVQVGDDIKGVWASDGIGEDVRKGEKWSLPVAFAMSVLPARQVRELNSTLGQAPANHAAAMTAMDLIESSGAKLYMRSKLHYYRRQACGLLDELVLDGGVSGLLARWLSSEE
jgi:geranylgeranyl pyrophosphate synthase